MQEISNLTFLTYSEWLEQFTAALEVNSSEAPIGIAPAAAPPKPGGGIKIGGAPAAPVVSAKERENEIRKKLGLKNKKSIHPNVKMRNIYWTAVPVEKLEGTIWPELSDQKIKFNVKDLEFRFPNGAIGSGFDHPWCTINGFLLLPGIGI